MPIPFLFKTRAPWSSSLLVNVLHLFCFYTFFNTLSPQICNAVNPGYICNSSLYSNGSKFESNLNTVLNNLVQRISSSDGYNTSVSGEVPNRIYGLLQCRGDLSMEQCHSCSQDLKASIFRVCPNAAGGRVYYEQCFMRYQNYNFIGKLDTESDIFYDSTIANHPDTYNSSVRGLLKNLSDEAPRLRKRFAHGSTIDSWYQQSNGMVQCWLDISIPDCQSCLTSAIAALLGVTNGTLHGGLCYMGSCTARYESYSFLTEAPPSPPPSLPPPSRPPSLPLPPPWRPAASTSKKSSKKTALVGGIVGGLLVMLLVGAAVFTKRRELKAAVFGSPISLEDGEMEEDSLISKDRPIIFNLETLKNATRNFHNDNKLGEGGFGPVYKGTLLDGKDIAVKKLSLKSVQGKQEFINEVKLVAKLQHKNLVHIFGCCEDGSERLLVYEFLSNKSLDKFLFDPLLCKQLDWKMRFNIILGIARGLVYLHEDSRARIIHRDIKASNILLDQRMNPKISDFGLARLFVEDESHVSTRVAGTFGYMAPEYAMRGKLSVKSDVYSFGVLLLEIVCGRKNTDYKSFPENEILMELVWRAFERRQAVDVMDRRIVEECGEEEGMRCIHVGLLCAQGDASLRPSMSSVYAMLSNLAMANLPHPTNPAFVNFTNDEMLSRTVTVSSSTASTSSSVASASVGRSINDTSVTELGGR